MKMELAEGDREHSTSRTPMWSWRTRAQLSERIAGVAGRENRATLTVVCVKNGVELLECVLGWAWAKLKLALSLG